MASGDGTSDGEDTTAGIDDTSGDDNADGGSDGETTDASSDDSSDDSSASDEDSPYTCGNGILEPDEVCDDGEENGSYSHCAQDCRGLASHCGDAVVDPEEVCDNGRNTNTYGGGCNPSCQSLAPYCGDAQRYYLESCDDGNDEINDGCNPDCSTPGETLWSQTWNSIDDAPAAISAWPAGIEWMPNGEAQLVVTELDQQETIWNLRIDPATGDVLSADQFSPSGTDHYRANDVARLGDALVIVGRRSDTADNPAVQTSVILYTAPDGNLHTTVSQPQETPWDRVVADPASGAIGVMHVTDSDTLVIRQYDGAAQLFETTSAGALNAEDYAIAYNNGQLRMAGFLQVGAGALGVLSWAADGSTQYDGFWGEPESYDNMLPRTLIPLSGGGTLAVGGYTFGGVSRAFVVAFADDASGPVWSVYETDGNSSSLDACETPLGNIIVLGTVGVTRLRKLTSTGLEIWSRVIGDGVTDRTTLTCDDAGGALLTGVVDNHVWFGRTAP
ncbi:MAG: DUF4215 domain-containing protein [Nannocystaceae bacterium]|nr:DUF4215 domain-containing protein [Nannocystaceae bacterium]